MTFTFADPIQVWLELSPASQTQAWQQSQSFSTPNSRWNAYLNQLCLSAALPWLQEESASRATPWPNSSALASFWEIVNGTAITLGSTRIVLVPTEAIDLSELRVSQEWVDIPSWSADYYLAAQVNPDDGWVRIWGYTTHQQLKTRGSYDAGDRTYCLDEGDLIQDLSVLWAARQLCPEELTRATIPLLPALLQTQAENLLQRLANPSIATPRLAIPFEQWGALLGHGGWRQRLCERRRGLPEQWSISQWFQASVSDLARQIGWQRVELQPSLAAWRSLEQAAPVLSRQLIIADQPYELQIIAQGNPADRILRFELKHASQDNSIPRGFKLRLLTEDLQGFNRNEEIATTETDRLYIDVTLESGEGVVWEIEPMPENYDQEILRF